MPKFLSFSKINVGENDGLMVIADFRTDVKIPSFLCTRIDKIVKNTRNRISIDKISPNSEHAQ